MQKRLADELVRHVPRTVLAIDEAQILMPSRGSSTARQALDSFVLEGELTIPLASYAETQMLGAISEAAASQGSIHSLFTG